MNADEVLEALEHIAVAFAAIVGAIVTSRRTSRKMNGQLEKRVTVLEEPVPEVAELEEMLEGEAKEPPP